ncbi:MAG: T9SS type A sorting domain-containing protein, partial [Flavobacteriales bacterium]|nr:T9SS type A sorting domain-containing protein [Flavobacteriales bacterium]
GLLMLMPHEYANSRLVHLDTLGNIIWDRNYGMRFERILALPDTSYLAVGRAGGGSPPGLQLTVTSISALGDSVCTRAYGDSLTDQGSSIALTPTGFIAYGTKDMYSGSVPPRLFLTWDTLDLFLGVGSQPTLPGRLAVFPNPATDQVTVQLSGPGSMTALEVHDAQERLVHQAVPQRGTSSWRLDTSALPNGHYLIRALTERGMVIGRAVVMGH